MTGGWIGGEELGDGRAGTCNDGPFEEANAEAEGDKERKRDDPAGIGLVDELRSSLSVCKTYRAGAMNLS